jgi:hypothetical protein
MLSALCTLFVHFVTVPSSIKIWSQGHDELQSAQSCQKRNVVYLLTNSSLDLHDLCFFRNTIFIDCLD